MKDIIGWLVKLNITDDFKKFFKWVLIIIVAIFLLIVIWFVGHIAKNNYDNSLETMIAIECDWDRFERTKSHYLRHKTFGSTEEKISKFLKEEGFTNESYQLAIKNESKGEKPNMGNYLEWYLVQKKRYIEKPHGLYRGRHLKAVVGDDKIYLSKELKDFDDNYYYFGISKTPKKDEKGHSINRKNLEISYYQLGISSTAQCNEISESEFYRNVEREIKIKKDSVKF